MKIKILGKIWNLKFVPNLGKNMGTCDPPDKKNKMIYIQKGLNDQEELTVLIHESLHAADWYKDEEWVTVVSQDIAKILFKLGYRKRKDEKNKVDIILGNNNE